MLRFLRAGTSPGAAFPPELLPPEHLREHVRRSSGLDSSERPNGKSNLATLRNFDQHFVGKIVTFCDSFEFGAVQKGENLVDLEQMCTMTI